MTDHPSLQPHDEISAESLLGQVADEFVERLDRGERVTIEEYAERYPQIASEIRQVLPALAVMQPADENADPICDGSMHETKFMPRGSCITPTSCRYFRSVANVACTFTPCSISTGRQSPM